MFGRLSPVRGRRLRGFEIQRTGGIVAGSRRRSIGWAPAGIGGCSEVQPITMIAAGAPLTRYVVNLVSYGPMAGAPPAASDTAAGSDLGRSSRRGWRGRSREWQVLAALLRTAEQSRGGVLLVEGRSGMGKTRLVGDAIEAAAARGFGLAHGAADEPSRLAPLTPLMTALGESPQTMREPTYPEQVFLRALCMNHDFRRGRRPAEAIAAANPEHSRAARVGAWMLLSHVAWGEGRAGDGLDHARKAVRVAPRDEVHARRVHPRLHLSTLLTDMRMPAEAEHQLQRVAEEVAEFGHTAYAPCPAIFRARLRLAEGRLDDAVAEAQAGLAVADEMGMHAFVLAGIAVLVVVAVHRGEVDAAAGHAQRYEERYREGARFGMAWGGWSLALLADARDGPRKALDVLHTACTDPAERRWLLMSEPDAAAWLSRTALAAGDRPAAEAVTGTAERLARANPGFPTLAASAAHARGILRGDRERLSRASAAHVGPWGRASAAEDLGVLLTGGDAAVGALDRALEGYQEMGALRDAARIRARLRRLGVRRRHWTRSERPAAGWSSLTETECTVAELAARGLTNPQVAAQMFVSPHTVKFHLRQVFRKLGIGSRVELARLAAEHVRT